MGEIYGQPTGQQCNPHGRPMGDARVSCGYHQEIHGRPTGDPCMTHWSAVNTRGRPTGQYCEPMEDPWVNSINPWVTHVRPLSQLYIQIGDLCVTHG